MSGRNLARTIAQFRLAIGQRKPHVLGSTRLVVRSETRVSCAQFAFEPGAPKAEKRGQPILQRGLCLPAERALGEAGISFEPCDVEQSRGPLFDLWTRSGNRGDRLCKS